MASEGLLGGTQQKLSDYSGSYKDEDLMRRLYLQNEMSQAEIAERLGCANSTVSNWLDEHGIEKRSRSEAAQLAYGGDPVYYWTRSDGREIWTHCFESEHSNVYVHRLLAVAKFGFDAVSENNVHHLNEHKWDNRHENIGLMSHGEHSGYHHTKVSTFDKVRMAEFYRNGDCTTYDLAEMFPLTQAYISCVVNGESW